MRPYTRDDAVVGVRIRMSVMYSSIVIVNCGCRRPYIMSTTGAGLSTKNRDLGAYALMMLLPSHIVLLNATLSNICLTQGYAP